MQGDIATLQRYTAYYFNESASANRSPMRAPVCTTRHTVRMLFYPINVCFGQCSIAGKVNISELRPESANGSINGLLLRIKLFYCAGYTGRQRLGGGDRK